MSAATPWLTVDRGAAPLIVSMPHAGTEIPPDIEIRLLSSWLARKDADWWIDKLYAFAGSLGATVVRTAISRTVIDVNRDPSGASLYPGAATTGLCPDTPSMARRSIARGNRRMRPRSPAGAGFISNPITAPWPRRSRDCGPTMAL